MTQNEMIELADKAGFFVKDNEAYSPSVQEDHELTPYLESFAKLIAERERERMTVVAMDAAEKAVDVAIKLEREACAKECWKQMGLLPIQAWTVNPYEQCIDAILARGQA